MRTTIGHRGVLAISVGLAAAAFVTDIRSGADLAAGALYLLSIFLGLWVDWRAYPIAAAIGATTLTGLVGVSKAMLPSNGDGVTERVLLALTCVVAAVAVRAYKARERRNHTRTTELEDIKRALDYAAIVATTDVTGRITYVNDKFCDISEYSREELLGRDHRIINSGYHPPEFISDLWRTIARGQIWHGELRNKAKSGRFYWVDTTIVPFLNEVGHPHQYIAIRADITDRKAAEERLVQQAALAQVGQMAAVVAHEVRNPLAGIKGTLQVLIGRREAGDDELPVMREVVARVDALSSLIDDLMTFARPRPPKLVAVDLKDILGEAVGLLRDDPACKNVDVAVSAEPTPTAVDPDLVRAALSNLFINAAHAMNGRGRIEARIISDPHVISIEVRDSGPGIPPEIRARVLEPFFTTKARGGGLGLPVAKRTAELHGGTLALSCPPGGGTTVTLTLKRSQLAPDTAPRS